MTVASAVSKITVAGNGSATSFAFPFKITSSTHLVVTKTTSTGVTTTLVLGTHYSVTGVGSESGGSITYPLSGTALPTGDSLTMRRVVPLTQSVDLTNQGAFYAEVHEGAFDSFTYMAQQLTDQISDLDTIVDGLVGDVAGDLRAFSFTGDGSTLLFDLGITLTGGVRSLIVAVDGAVQGISTYGISGTNLQFTEAPPYRAAVDARVVGQATVVDADYVGPAGPTGPTGLTGATGAGVPTGGSIGQYLTKVSGTSYDTTWSTLDLSIYAPLASPTLTGVPLAPTAAALTSTTQIATTAFATTADALKANLASPTFTGTPAAPTAAALTSTTQLATTAFVTSAAALKADLASPTFTGVPLAPTAAAATSTTQLATTAFVTVADALKANLASPTFTGTPAAPTAAALTSTTQLATTAFVTTAAALKADLASPTFTGTPAAPTAAAATSTTQLATTAFVSTADALKANLASPTFSGNIGLGRSPYVTANFTTLAIQGTNGGVVEMMDTAGDLFGRIYTEPTDVLAIQNSRAGGKIVNRVVGTDRTTITNTGQFFVGTTVSTNPGVEIGPSGYVYIGNSAAAGGTGLINCYRSAVYIGGLTQNGTTGVTFATSSDYRLKEHVEPLTGALERLAELAPKRFNFIAEPGRVLDGFLAHEVQAVVPEAVTGEKDGEAMQGLDASRLIPLLTAAVIELAARVAELEG